MVWSALIGFLVLMAFVIGLATASTNRYEREQRARARSARPASATGGVARGRPPRRS